MTKRVVNGVPVTGGFYLVQLLITSLLFFSIVGQYFYVALRYREIVEYRGKAFNYGLDFDKENERDFR
jgi:hypothetical protein